MRSLLSKITAVAAVAFMMLGFLAVPSAEAQTYPPVFPGAVDCNSDLQPKISIVGTQVVVEYAQGTLTCGVRSVVQVNPVLYNGPIPSSLTHSFPLPALAGDNHTATVDVTFSNGIVRSDSVKISAAALSTARANFAASGLPGSASVPAAGASVPVPAQNLAFTGSSVNFPLAAGAMLVGAGGLTLLAARKREQNT